MRGLKEYTAKRDFRQTTEPKGSTTAGGAAPRFSFQKHDATRIHWDLRLEHDGVLLSWAVTRGPSLDPKDKRLAVRTEDHPFDYLTYEGVIPKGNYGAGTVMLWDIGWWQPFHDVDEGLASGHLHFALLGQRSTGKWSLIRMKGKRAEDAKRENWLLVKESDEAARNVVLTEIYDTSVTSGRNLAEIAAGKPDLPRGPSRNDPAPKFHAPQLAELHDAPPTGDVWWHEIKLDGYRAQIALGKGGAKVFTRNGLDWTEKFPPLLPALSDLPAKTALIDGEIVAGAGLERFGDVARAIADGGPFLFYGFDLLFLDGRDLTDAPLHIRREALEGLFADKIPRGVIRLSPVLSGESAELFKQIEEAGGEGLVSKLRNAPYRSGRSAAWVKSKVERRGAFVIVGYQHSTVRGRLFSSLLLADWQEGKLTYRGKVGTGFDATKEDDLRKRLSTLKRDTPALEHPPMLRTRVTWVEPSLIGEIRYGEITRDGHLRHASFIAIREDKVMSQAITDDPGTRPRIAGVGISNPDRVVYPKPKVTKLDVAEYYQAVADHMLAVARNRPLSLLRLPDGLEGQKFFQKHRGKGFPAAMRQMDLPDSKGQMQDKMFLTTPASILAAVQMGTIEFHIEGVRIDKPQVPDRLILDLDPDEGLGFAAVRDGAFLIRDLLIGCGLQSSVMVTGGKGVHVTVPLRRTASTESVTLFARTFSTLLAEQRPKNFTARMSKAERSGKIFIDWLRNDHGSTAVAPFSLRARAGAPVAMPVSWEELRTLRRANAFDIRSARSRDWSPIGAVKAGSISDKTVAAMTEALANL